LRRLFPLLLLAAGCAGLPHPDPDDVSRARSRWPDVTQASLEEGRTHFVNLCSGCHDLPAPSQKSAAEWPKVVREMSTKITDVDERDLELIERFLVTMSQRQAIASK
jgi:hypothetical protein